jgi:quercetin dioxygenase-like cupin family protein
MKKNIKDHLSAVHDYFSPLVIGEVNDVYVKVVKILGEEIPWHNHAKEDELFFIVEGKLLFEVENQSPFTMEKGDVFIVKRGINHRVSATDECHLILIENKSTAHTGNVVAEVTKTIAQQLSDE